MIFIFFCMLFHTCLYIFQFFYFYKSEKFVDVFYYKNQTWIPDQISETVMSSNELFFMFLQEPLSPISPEAQLSGAPLF